MVFVFRVQHGANARPNLTLVSVTGSREGGDRVLYGRIVEPRVRSRWA